MSDHVAARLAISICGAGHSGSTLLGLVLGSHPRGFYAGEAKKSRFVGDPSKPLRKRVCKICGESCVVWSKFAPPGDPSLYDALARITGKDVIVDSTKDVEWVRAHALQSAAARREHRLIFLQRDGRAVINSRVRKYSEDDPREMIDEWVEQLHKTELLCAEFPSMRVRYEELATEPEKIVRSICSFLGIEFDPQMLDYQAREHHPLGGNTGTQSVVARANAPAATLAEVPNRSRDYYESLRGGFRLDLRWRTELPANVLQLFEERAGAINEPFRWGDDR